MKVINIPFWRWPNPNAQTPPYEKFKPSADVIHGYANDLDKYGYPLDSDMAGYFRKCANWAEQFSRKDSDND